MSEHRHPWDVDTHPIYTSDGRLPDGDTVLAPTPKRRSKILIASIVIVVLTGIVLGWIGLKSTVLKDSGVVACEAMAERADKNREASGKKWTKAEYNEVREMFADSDHEDIRKPGVKLVDTIWNLQNIPEDAQVGMALLSVGSLMTAMQDLQTGCKNHGVDVDLMSNATK